MNAITATAEALTETPAIEDNSQSQEPSVEETKLGEFKIVLAAKRTIKSSCSGQMIEALKRAKSPLGLNALASRVNLTKAGQALKVKDVKARVSTCAKWYKKNTDFVDTDEKGRYFLVRADV